MKFDHNVTVTKLKRIWNKYTNNERMGGGGGVVSEYMRHHNGCFSFCSYYWNEKITKF